MVKRNAISSFSVSNYLLYFRVLIPIADTGEYPVNLAAIKMMTKVVEKLTKEEAEECLPEIIPKLVKVSTSIKYRPTLGLSRVSIFWPVGPGRAFSG